MKAAAQKRAATSGAPPWQSKLEAVEQANIAEAKTYAHVHASELIRCLADTKRTLKEGMILLRAARPGARPKLLSGRTPLADALWWCDYIPNRMEPLLAAVKKVEGGTLPEELDAAEQSMRRAMQGLDRAAYRSGARGMILDEQFVLQRIATHLDRFRRYLLRFYAQAQERHGLIPLRGA